MNLDLLADVILKAANIASNPYGIYKSKEAAAGMRQTPPLICRVLQNHNFATPLLFALQITVFHCTSNSDAVSKLTFAVAKR